MKKLCCLLALLLMMAARAESINLLCVGITSYDDGTRRVGGINATQGVFDAFVNAGECASAEKQLDLTKAELVALLESVPDTRAEMTVIYINAHGGAQDGLNWIETREGARLTPAELESAVRKRPGRVVLLIDCCNSGGFIGEADFADAFSSGFMSAFYQNANPGGSFFASSKYLVCTSCSFDQNSYRIANSSLTEENMSTVFARALCDALGWDLIKDRPARPAADINRDHSVTFTEMCLYTRQRCRYYLSFSTPARQTVMYTEGADAVLITRRPGKTEEIK